MQSGSGLNAQAATAQTSAASSPVNPFASAVEGSTLQPESLSPSAVQPALQAAGSALLLWQGPTQIRVGDTFALQLVMQTDRPVVSVPLAIGFDPRLLQVANVSEGGFLKQGGAQTSFTYRIDPGGQVLMTATRSGDGGATAPDTLATINFRALAAGTARVELITIAPVASGGLTINPTLPGAHALTIAP